MIGFIMLIYAIFIAWLILGKKTLRENSDNAELSVSVIVPYRNEQNNLKQLLEGLSKQNYNQDKLEIILVNDHSTDDSYEIAENALVDFPFQCKHLSQTKNSGKKSAIKLGIKNSEHEIILCTDADCTMEENWVKQMQTAFHSEQVHMALGPLLLESDGTSWFQKLQAFEFSALMALTWHTTRRSKPILSNGANVAFRKELFASSKGYEGNQELASGDDIFLLHAFKREFGRKGIVFVADEKALVKTKSTSGLKPFINQRIRWASKSKKYKDYDTIIFGLVITAANLAILTAFVGFLFQLNSLSYLLGAFCFKWILDLLLVQQLPHWLRVNSIVKWSFILSLFYPSYSVGIALLSLFYRPEWKGRKI